MSGKVTSVQEDALLGNSIVIEHEKGMETHYSSVTDIEVKEGETVKQGEAIAKSSTSGINAEAGNHVHFEIRKDQTAVNPLDYLDKPLSSLKADQSKAEEKAADQKDEKTTTEDSDSTETGEETGN